jgi:hypothetical protein
MDIMTRTQAQAFVLAPSPRPPLSRSSPRFRGCGLRLQRPVNFKRLGAAQRAVPLVACLPANGGGGGGNDAGGSASAALLEAAAAAVAAPALAIVLWSEAALVTTGCGLPAGPGGALGAAEGVGYLVLFGVLGTSVALRLRTGKGLPVGPAGVLAAVEASAYLVTFCGLLATAYVTYKYGLLPGASLHELGSRCNPVD